MSVSLLEVIEHGGYDLTLKEDARWLISKQAEFEELVEQAQELLEEDEEEETALVEKRYKEIFS